MVKEQYRVTDITSKIASITFGKMSPQQLQQLSHVQVVAQNLYEEDSHIPLECGLMDTRMGISKDDTVCGTCGKGLSSCVGHFGYIDLELPVFHVGYFKQVIAILQTICKSCSHVLLSEKMRVNYRAKLRSSNIPHCRKTELRKQIREQCKRVTRCPHCRDLNGTVKKCGMLKISHDKFSSIENDDVLLKVEIEAYENAVQFNSEIEPLVSSALVDELNLRDVAGLLERIPDQDIQFLLMNPRHGHPKDMILKRVLVPPVCIRPSVVSDLKLETKEDPLTIKLKEIIFMNNVIAKLRLKKAEHKDMLEAWCYLQLRCAMYIDSHTFMVSETPTLGLVQRLEGPKGRLHGNTSGKRVDFSARTIISSDPNLRIDQVGVPELIAKILTYPTRVNEANIDLMRELVRNGADVHPGANCLQKKSSGRRIYLNCGNRDIFAQHLKIGDFIERHLMDEDIVVLNRQPSWSKLSIMCHRAKISPHLTIRFNGCVCPPYQASFDGDEMNLHFPQTEEARAEALILMSNKSNLVTPRNGELLVAPIQDFVTGAYLLTLKDAFFDRAKTCQLVASMLAGDEVNMVIKLPPPCIQKPVALWSGKQIFSLILRPNPEDRIKINLRTKGKEYSKKNEEFCVNDGFLLVRNSEVLAGCVDKSTIGSGSKINIFYVLLRDYGEDFAIRAMWKLCRVASYYMMNRGFSIGIGDVTPGKSLLKETQKLLQTGYAKCDEYIRLLTLGQLPRILGCNEALESNIFKELSGIPDKAIEVCKKELHPSNSPLVMSKSGSKRSYKNISQIIACVGQQSVKGKRVSNGFEDRSLPHFQRHSKTPASKGFVSNSFYSGLTPTEFFFHTMDEREGLVDKDLKIVETGNLQRQLVKRLEDICGQYDSTVRNSSGEIIQFKYGGDGLDPSYMEAKDRPVDFQRTLDHIKAAFPYREEESLNDVELQQAFNSVMEADSFKELGIDFQHELRVFVESQVKRIKKMRQLFKMEGRILLPVEKYLERITISQLVEFYDFSKEKYKRAVIEPGTAVGAVCAQSIGETGIQMTLKTLHFAGVDSKNITQGVTRIKEIINAPKTIRTPIISTQLLKDDDPEYARRVKGRVEITTLGEVTLYMEEIYSYEESFVFVKLDMSRIQLLKLEVDAHSIKQSLRKSDLPIKSKVKILEETGIVVRPKLSSGSDEFHVMQKIKELLPKVVIKGYKTVRRATITVDNPRSPSKYGLIVEGDGMREVMATYGVKGTSTTSNNIFEVFSTLGIEAARATIARELQGVIEGHGMHVDRRHIALLSDLMSYHGKISGVPLTGLSTMKESVLLSASCEGKADKLFEASYYGQEDKISGVSECIIMGIPMSIGTGVFKLLHKTGVTVPPKTKPLLFDVPEHHVPLV